MRKKKRFTPRLIRSWGKKQRGTGTGENYTSWHQVARSDPASCGRSHLINWITSKRLLHLLSDAELLVLCFIVMLGKMLVEVLEQFPLSLETHQFELAKFSSKWLSSQSPGTLQLAEELNIKYPVLKSNGEVEYWVMTTDLLVVIRLQDGSIELLAISVKAENTEKLSKSDRELLNLEREYWARQGVQWLLITPKEYQRSVAASIKNSIPWGLSTDLVEPIQLNVAGKMAPMFDGKSLTTALGIIQQKMGVDQQTAQRIFWQAVWCGEIQIDLSRHYWPSTPFRIVSHEEFLSQNPVATRRSACL